MEQFCIILSFKVTPRISSFFNVNVSVIVNAGSWPTIGLSIIKHVLDEVKIRLISKLINGISRVLQKLYKDFNGIF